jgi:serine/threonine-protein kinase
MEPLLVRLQRALAGRYSVEHELGRGGMAVVFLGHDVRHERLVRSHRPILIRSAFL